MKLKTITYAIAAALSGVVIGQAAATQVPYAPSHPTSVQTLKPVTLSAEQIKQRQQSRAFKNSRVQNEGLNVTLQPKKVNFTREDGLKGDHVYIVRLRHNPISQYSGGIQGLAATKLSPEAGEQRLYQQGKPASTAVAEYQQFLLEQQADVVTRCTMEQQR